MRLTVVPAIALALSLAATSGCDQRPPVNADTSSIDDLGDTVRVTTAPLRIVSLNPTTTELMFAIGAGSRLAGRTHWDLYPDSARFVPDLGNGIQPNIELILAAKPDLVLLYAAEANRPAASALRRAGIMTLSLRIDHIDDFYRALRMLGTVTGDSARAGQVKDSVRTTLERVRRATASLGRPRVFWPVWEQPLLAVGGGSFLSELVSIAGGKNVYDSLNTPSPQVTMEDVVRMDPDIVLTGPQNAPRIRTDVAWRRLRAVRENRVLVVDTVLMLRPAVRLGEAAVSLARLIHPESGLE